MESPNRYEQAFASCQRFLSGHGPRRMRASLRALLAEVAEDELADFYGAGAVLESFEAELAVLFGKPAAVFMPSGVMAQLIALRVACERRARSTVAFHATSHLELHEARAYAVLHQLRACLIGDARRPLEPSDLDAIVEPIGALLLELPQRELGGILPSWSEVEVMASWAQRHGTALHLDGARIWESRPFYGREYAEIAAPFDTLYVSFYKTLGGMAGAALLGDADSMQEARTWQRRMGGNLISMYPYVLAARAAMRERLPRIASYCERARQVSAQLTAIAGVMVTPDPPSTNMMHVSFPVEGQRLLRASAEIAQRTRVALVQRVRPSESRGTCTVELMIGDGALQISDAELGSLLSEMVSKAG